MALFVDINTGNHPACAKALDELEWPWRRDPSSPLSYQVASMLWLDRYFGKDDPSNIIWLEEDEYGSFDLCFKHVDPEAKALDDRIRVMLTTDPAYEGLEQQLIRLLCSRPFRMQFIRPDNPDEDMYPEWLQGKTRNFQLFTDSEDEMWPVMYTTRSDGTKITLP